MEENLKCISFNCKNKLSIYSFLLPILYCSLRFFHDKVFELCEPELSYKILKYNLPYLFYLYFPKILSIICVKIIKIKTEFSSEERIIKKNYHIFIEKRDRKKLLIFIYIISLLEVLQDDGDSLLTYYQRSQPTKRIIKGWLIEKRTGLIIFVPIFCYFILLIEIHRHHILALILGYIGALIINGCRFFLGFSYLKDFRYHLLNAFFSLLYSLALVLTKYTMMKYILRSPYIFLFYDGIFCIINSIIIALLQYKIIIRLPDDNKKIKTEENNKYFNNNFLEIFTIFYGQKLEFYIYFVLSFIFHFFYYIINIFTIYNYSPYLIILLEALIFIDIDSIENIFKIGNIDNRINVIKRTIIQSIGHIILFFGSLILNEIIIFNCLGLNRNIFLTISQRGKLESSGFINDDKYLSDDEDDNLSEAS